MEPAKVYPTGTVTFLFTDIEGSTKRWQADPEAMEVALARHDALLREVVAAHGGVVFKTVGDAICAAFPAASPALAAALAAQRALAAEAWGAAGPLRVRMALHAGTAQERDADYLGPVVNRVARLLAAGHGGQVLLSAAVRDLAREDLPAGTSLRDLGEHRLKDLAVPERIFQLLASDLPAAFPPLATLDRLPHNLPAQPTPLVGREQEVARVVDLLGRDDIRLLTLTGPGGIGKTRLALQAAAELLDQYPHGAWFVDLTPLSDPVLVPAAVAGVLGVREEGGQPLVNSLADFLAGKQLLLVLDNCERVVEAAPFVAGLLAAAPGLKVLATSRVRLRLRGEREVAVPPLGLPDPTHPPDLAEFTRSEAVRLFIARAQDALPDFAVTDATAPAVAAICHRLDGLPLAIELAAARVKLLPPPAMLARLEKRLPLLVGGDRDRPERQQTLRGAIAWSHDGLKPGEQALFARLAIFAGGCALDAVEHVCGGIDDLGFDLLNRLESLVDNSLVRQIVQAGEEPRFEMLSTIREYGLEQLQALGELNAVSEAYAEFYFGLAKDAATRLRSEEQGRWLQRLELEQDNLRAALDWLMLVERAESHARLVNALAPFWWARGHLTEGRRWLERSLSQSDGAPPRWRARTLTTAGGFALYQGDYSQARALQEQALALYQEIQDREGVADALVQLGAVATEQGEYNLAQGRYEECLAIYRELGDSRRTSIAVGWLGELAFRREEYSRAMVLFEEALANWRILADEQMVAVSLANLAEAHQHQGELDQATALFQEALSVFRRLGDKQHLAFALFGLGNVALMRNSASDARGLLGESLTLARQLGDKAMIAGCLESLAGVDASENEAARAARLFGAADRLRETIGAPRQPAYEAERDRRLAAVRTLLGEAGFVTAWQAGQNLAADMAVDLALAPRSDASASAPRPVHADATA